MKVLFATPEASPFIKTGGLGDVAGSLPSVLKEKGIDVRVIYLFTEPFHNNTRTK